MAGLVNGPGVPVDDLEPITNTVQQADLTLILRLTPDRHRANVVMAFLGLAQFRWAEEAGFDLPTVSRWFNYHNKLPFGAAVRLARVVGIDPVLLFSGYL